MHPPARSVRARPLAGLVAGSDCSRLLARVKREALTEVGPYGLVPPVATGAVLDGPVAVSMSTSTGSAAGAGAESAGASDAPQPFSTTNDQEAGVDEPDLAKTDGRLLVALRSIPRERLEVVDVTGSRPRLDAHLGLPHTGYGAQLFLVGSFAVVLGDDLTPPPPGGYDGLDGQPKTRVTVVALDRPSSPRIARSFTVTGMLVGAREISGHVVVVTQGSPRLPFVGPRGPHRRQLHRAAVVNRRLVLRSRLAQWLPAVSWPGASTRPVNCPAVYRTAVPSGLGSVAVVSFDPASGSAPTTRTVLGTASVVYASTEALYLATTPWQDVVGMQVMGTTGPARVRTQVHGFDLSDPARPRYVGSGVVPGTLLGQYAMSEDHGYLRVATTVGIPLPAPGEGAAPKIASDNMVTVLRPVAGTLAPVGRIDGLGRGERIYGVRFVGDLGYVVTYRQIDPLFVIDFSDPRHPTLRGRLTISGYSSYLHPLGDGLLLGVGVQTTRRMRPIGAQVSVFDVSNLARPRLRARTVFRNGFTDVENDPHTFLWWPSSRLAIVAMTQNSFSGEVVFRVGRDGSLDEIGRVDARDPAYADPAFERALVVGDLLYTVSEGGLVVSRLGSLDDVAWMPFS